MLIGFDFDNTIVCYDALFYKVALEQGHIHADVPISKIAVRDYLRKNNKEDIWTMMQGYVYGARMLEAESYPNLLTVMKRIKKLGHELVIVSHKTKTPYMGEPYDLHVSARNWLAKNLTTKQCDYSNARDLKSNHDMNANSLISDYHIYFELTQEDKITRISDLKCDIFIDDLPEILCAKHFPCYTRRFLFDPENNHNARNFPDITHFSNWAVFENYL